MISKFIKIVTVPLFITMVNNGSVKASEDILELKECPQKLIPGIYLDGGTYLVKVITKQETTLYFGLENPSEKIFWRSKISASESESELVEQYKTVKVFLNAPSPNTEKAIILPFKGKVENQLQRLVRSWFDCSTLSENSKKEIKNILGRLNSPRIRKVVVEGSENDKESKSVEDIRKLLNGNR